MGKWWVPNTYLDFIFNVRFGFWCFNCSCFTNNISVIRYPGVKDLNKLYGLDFVPGKLNKVCPGIGYGLLVLNIGLSAYSNFTNDNLTIKQRWISFGVDTAYTLGTFGIGYGVGALVSLIPGVGVFIAPFVSAGVTWFIDWTNEKWGWLDDVKQWFNDL